MQVKYIIPVAIQLPFLIKRVSGYISKQKGFININLGPVLSHAELLNDGSLDDNDFKKITGYYGLAVPAVLGEAFCALRGIPMTDKERWASTCQGAMTGLFDDFFDKDHLDVKIIETKIEAPVASTKKSNEKLFEIFYNKALENVPDRVSMKGRLSDVYHAQVESKEQNDTITTDRILSITLNKGGTSLQFYRTAFSHPYLKGEEELIYRAGGVMQLANDIFDVYKDREGKIKTLVTAANHIKEVQEVFTRLLSGVYNDAVYMPYPQKNIRLFLNILSTCIFSRCYVCLAHLKKNELRTGGVFIIDQYSRKDLICDMDTKKNMLRAAAYHLQTISY